MLAVAWLEYMMGEGLVVSSKLATELPKVCKPHKTNTLGPKASVIINNQVVSTTARLVWSDLFVANFLKEYFPSRVDSSGGLLR